MGCLRHAGACLSPSVILNLVCLAGAQAIYAAQGQVRSRRTQRWHPLCQLEEKLYQVARSIDQVAEVFHFVRARIARGGCCVSLAGAHSSASTLPAVARVTAGRFVRYEWLQAGVGRDVVY